MGRLSAVLLALLVAWPDSSTAAAAQAVTEREALGRQVEQRFDVLPVQAGVVLKPKGAAGDVRSIELSDGAIAIDGRPVTGSELRERLGADADMILRLSYLDASEQRALFEPRSSTPPDPQAAPVAPPSPTAPAAPRPRRMDRGSDRVRIGGGLLVGPGETVNGNVVAIGGPANVDGQVRGDVVAIGGGVTLGPRADIGGDVTVIGGPLQRDPAARIGGEIHEVALGDVNLWPGWRRMWPPFGGQNGASFGSPFGSVFALVSTVARAGVLCILASIVLLFARGYVERISLRAASEPMKAGLAGLLIQLLFAPLLLATIFVMVITIIGIPLAVLLAPLALLALALLFLVGFTAVAYDVGRLTVARLGREAQNPYLVAAMGIVVVLSPVLISRLIGLAGGPVWPITWTLLLLGLLLEYLVWTVGLGAVALLRFDRK